MHTALRWGSRGPKRIDENVPPEGGVEILTEWGVERGGCDGVLNGERWGREG